MATDPNTQSTQPTPRRRHGLRTELVVIAVAFVLGMVLMGALVRYHAGWLILRPPAAKGGTAPEGVPSMFVPPPEADGGAKAPDAQALEARLGILSARLAELEQRALVISRDAQLSAGNAGRAEALLIAFAARRAIDRGLSLGYLEPLLRARFGVAQPQAVRTVIAAARAPVTIEDLRLSLDAIETQLVTGRSTDGWWASFRREIAGLIVIRQQGTPSPQPRVRLARIQRMLDARQVEVAIAELSRMPGAARAGAWIAAAKRFVAAHRALDEIEASAILSGGTTSTEAIMPERASDARPAPLATPIGASATPPPAAAAPATAATPTTTPALATPR